MNYLLTSGSNMNTFSLPVTRSGIIFLIHHIAFGRTPLPRALAHPKREISKVKWTEAKSGPATGSTGEVPTESESDGGPPQ